MSQMIVDLTDFESGMNGWEVKAWMPNGRKLKSEISHEKGCRSQHCIQFDADGSDDDGIFFLQKVFTSDIEGLWSAAAVSWCFAGAAIIGTTAWPRVIYIGKPIDLAKPDMQHTFHWFKYEDGMETCPECDGWYRHKFAEKFDPPLEQFQVCVGWKINWETPRTLYIDDLLVEAA